MDVTFTAAQLGVSTSSLPASNSNSLSNASNTQAFSFSPKSDMSFLPHPNSLSSKSSLHGPSGPVVEDALRARAEQAESAAERLLELVDTEEDQAFSPTGHFSHNEHGLNGSSSNGVKASLRGMAGGASQFRPPVTPTANRTSVLRRAAQFQDSPHEKRGTSSMIDILKDHQDQSGWWLKRMKSAPTTSLMSYNWMLTAD
jgi:CLIP-associating protein 1/2